MAISLINKKGKLLFLRDSDYKGMVGVGKQTVVLLNNLHPIIINEHITKVMRKEEPGTLTSEDLKRVTSLR